MIRSHAPRAITATSILIDAIREADGHGKKTFEVLKRRSHPEVRSAMRILRRTLMHDRTATHVAYSGRGMFHANPGTVWLEAFYDDLTRRPIGEYDVAVHGPLNVESVRKIHLARVPEARGVCGVNAEGERICVHSHPYPAGWTNPHVASSRTTS